MPSGIHNIGSMAGAWAATGIDDKALKDLGKRACKGLKKAGSKVGHEVSKAVKNFDAGKLSAQVQNFASPKVKKAMGMATELLKKTDKELQKKFSEVRQKVGPKAEKAMGMTTELLKKTDKELQKKFSEIRQKVGPKAEKAGHFVQKAGLKAKHEVNKAVKNFDAGKLSVQVQNFASPKMRKAMELITELLKKTDKEFQKKFSEVRQKVGPKAAKVKQGIHEMKEQLHRQRMAAELKEAAKKFKRDLELDQYYKNLDSSRDSKWAALVNEEAEERNAVPEFHRT